MKAYICNFNRVGHCRRLCTWFRVYTGCELTVIDTGSDSCVDSLYDTLKMRGIRVIRLNPPQTTQTHLSPAAFLNGDLAANETFIYSDSDMLPESAQIITTALRLLNRYPEICKVGPALRLDLPRCNPFREGLQRHETSLLKKEYEPGVWLSLIDTTFAVYRSVVDFGRMNRALRLTTPGLRAWHFDWYEDPRLPSSEYAHYIKTAGPCATYVERVRRFMKQIDGGIYAAGSGRHSSGHVEDPVRG